MMDSHLPLYNPCAWYSAWLTQEAGGREEGWTMRIRKEPVTEKKKEGIKEHVYFK